MIVPQRYDRQARIEGWDQQKIADARVALIGGNYLSELTALSLAALGIGHITWMNESPKEYSIIDRKEARFFSSKKDYTLEEILTELNPDIKLNILPFYTISTAGTYFLEGSDILISTEGSLKYSAPIIDHAAEKKKPAIISLIKNNSTETYVYNPKIEDLPRNFLKLKENPAPEDFISSIVTSGLITEEVKKLVLSQETARGRIIYGFENKKDPQRDLLLPKKNILMIGAGALNNFVGLGIAVLGKNGLRCDLTIMDDDTIEETNLNRQILFYDAVGKHKAPTLAEKIREISCKNIAAKEIVQRFAEDFDISKYDIIIDGVDNFETRLILSEKTVREKKVLISGGTSYRAGQVVTYIPGRTSCVKHVLNLEQVIKKREEERAQSQSCIYQPDPSVIMSNEITGGLVVNELRKVLCPEVYGEPINGSIRYDSETEPRIGMNILIDRCGD